MSTTTQVQAPKAPLLGVIGGSGLYDMEGLGDVAHVSVETPYGAPSDEIILGTLAGTRAAFLPRHGRGHRYLPSEVPYLANVYALKKLGCSFVLSVTAVGSLREEIAPGHVVVVDQFIDRTVARPRTFFGGGVVGHVPFGDPVCPTLKDILLAAAQATTATVHARGTYVCIEGPTFSTKAESHLFRSWNAAVVGMTNLPEARLVREAGMSYATLAMVTDYDCWHDSEEAVSVDAVVAAMKKNVTVARAAIAGVAKRFSLANAVQRSPFADVARSAVMTDPALISAQNKERLRVLFPHL